MPATERASAAYTSPPAALFCRAAVNPVFTSPGSSATACTPNGRSSFCSAIVTEAMAALAAE